MRLQQLRDLAFAFDIDIPRDGILPEVLPVMAAAEAQGIFQGTPKRPEYLVKAARSADDPLTDDWMNYRKPEPKPLRAVSEFNTLQKLAKENGINSFGKKKDVLEAEMKAKGLI